MNNAVLIIEDHREILENISELLQLENLAVFEARSGEEGIVIARQKQPGLILCDIRLPKMDGYNVLSFLKSHPLTKHIPFVFITSLAENRDKKKGMDCGASAYLVKPFESELLIQTVNDLINEPQFKKKKYLKALVNHEFS